MSDSVPPAILSPVPRSDSLGSIPPGHFAWAFKAQAGGPRYKNASGERNRYDGPVARAKHAYVERSSTLAGCARRAADKIGGATVSGLSTLSLGPSGPRNFMKTRARLVGARFSLRGDRRSPQAGCARRAADKIGGATCRKIQTRPSLFPNSPGHSPPIPPPRTGR